MKSSEDLLLTCLSKIQELNPKVNAITVLNETAIEEAKRFDRENNNEKTKYLLQGLPILIKDTFETKKILTTAGSEKYKDYIPRKDAEIVKRIKDNGGVILGKSNTPDMAMDIQTFNSLFGTTNNPWNITKTPGGSSGGSTAAVASGMVSLAIGSDLAGSLRIPASFCGIYSLRPTEGRLPLDGHIPPEPGNPIPRNEIVVGPIANSLEGIELLMRAMCGSSVNYEYPKIPYQPAKLPSKEALKVAFTYRFPYAPIDNRIINKMKEIQSLLESNGITSEEINPELPLKQLKYAHKIFYDQLMHVKPLENPTLKDETDMSPSANQILNALKIRDKGRKLVTQLLNRYSIWIVPVTGTLPFDHNPNHKPIEINGEKVPYWRATIEYCVPFSVIGYPIVTLPIGFVNELPVGVQVIGTRWKDEELVAVCKTLERTIREL